MACFPLNFLSEEITTYVLSLAEHSLGVFSHQSAWSNRLLRTLYYKDTNCRNNHFSLFPACQKEWNWTFTIIKKHCCYKIKEKVVRANFCFIFCLLIRVGRHTMLKAGYLFSILKVSFPI